MKSNTLSGSYYDIAYDKLLFIRISNTSAQLNLFQRDGVGGIAFLLINYIGVNLSGGNVFMR